MPTSEDHDDQPDPSEIEPTDNSSGVPIDLERLDEIDEQTPQPSDE